jgi:hypothetical protein
MYKLADHPQERLEERTSLPSDFPARIRKILRKKRLPKGNVYAVMPDGSYAAFKDTHKGDKVLATFLSQNMTPRGENVTSEFADLKVAALSKLAGFANERLAQKAHRAVVKQYGLTEADGEKYWKLKSAIYQKMGGEFTHKTASFRMEPMHKVAESFVPPPAVASAAARGLEYRAKASPSNKGGLSVSEAHQQGIGSGVQRAVNLKNRDAVSMDTINRMVSFFARHAGNESVSPENKGTPWNDKGYVAYLLWGGGAGKAWANSIKNKMESKDTPREADKMAAAINALMYKAASAPNVATVADVVKSIGHTVSKAPATGGLASMGTRAAVGGLVGGTAGAASAGEGNRTKGFLLGGALGAAGGAASTLSRNAIYGKEGLHALQVSREAGKLRYDAPALKSYVKATIDNTPLAASPVTKGTAAIPQKGSYAAEAADKVREHSMDLLTDKVPLSKTLGSAAVTGAATLGAGALAGNMVSKTSMLNLLLSPPEP